MDKLKNKMMASSEGSVLKSEEQSIIISEIISEDEIPLRYILTTCVALK